MLVGVGECVDVDTGETAGVMELITVGIDVGSGVLEFVSNVFVLPLLNPKSVKSATIKTRKRKLNVPIAILAFVLHVMKCSCAGWNWWFSSS